MAALTNAVKLGKDCSLTIDGSTIKGVTSVSISCEADAIDVSTRDDFGYAKELPGKKTVTVDIELKRVEPGSGETDTQEPLFTAWASQTPAGVAIVASGGLLNVNGDFIVESLEESQEFDDAVTISASLKNYGAVMGGSGSGE